MFRNRGADSFLGSTLSTLSDTGVVTHLNTITTLLVVDQEAVSVAALRIKFHLLSNIINSEPIKSSVLCDFKGLNM